MTNPDRAEELADAAAAACDDPHSYVGRVSDYALASIALSLVEIQSCLSFIADEVDTGAWEDVWEAEADEEARLLDAEKMDGTWDPRGEEDVW